MLHIGGQIFSVLERIEIYAKLILQKYIVDPLVRELAEEGEKAPVSTGADTHGGKERNEAFINQYRSRARNL